MLKQIAASSIALLAFASANPAIARTPANPIDATCTTIEHEGRTIKGDCQIVRVEHPKEKAYSYYLHSGDATLLIQCNQTRCELNPESNNHREAFLFNFATLDRKEYPQAIVLKGWGILTIEFHCDLEKGKCYNP